ncbi:alpha/beta hydrolase [Cellulomonas cellasea]|uniref:alpha/beta fold hydrolase n=1 Tax=Cellulomonas cellasea TaxID=43670 RepID=UPI0025A4B934|nr:alpha/beta hydrolase [Cellulomonas cellasea]MDM8084384.1 alpha/beta hydrolase [Cellulomonas cellasea]
MPDTPAIPTSHRTRETVGGAARATTWVTAPTLHLGVAGNTLAYRELGANAGTPVLLLTHLSATLDEWDPRVVDALAAGRRVIAVDLPGVGGSTGAVPLTVQGMADAARAFVAALGLTRIDLLGFSLGGFVAQQVALDDPGLVRRLVLTGTGPAGGAGIDHPTGAAYIYVDMVRAALARTDVKELLFFPRTPAGKAAAKDYLARIRERVMDRNDPITLTAFRRQITSIKAWGRQQPQDLAVITAPTLIANGDHDRMVPTALSRDMHARIPDSTLVIYPESGHGGVFHHHRHFIPTLLAHLDA